MKVCTNWITDLPVRKALIERNRQDQHLSKPLNYWIIKNSKDLLKSKKSILIEKLFHEFNWILKTRFLVK